MNIAETVQGNEARPRLDLVFLGAPGAGKGTQAAHVGERLEILCVASGDLFRENLKNQTELGLLAKSYMDSGGLVPDDVTEAMVRERLSQPDALNGFILDGFPRNLSQAEALTEMMIDLQRQLAAVLYLKVSDEEIVTRLSGRLICRNCQTPYHLTFNPPAKKDICDVCGGPLYQRDDDAPETVRNRLKTFHHETEPLVAYYREAGLLIEIDAEGDLPTVRARIMAAIGKLSKQ